MPLAVQDPYARLASETQQLAAAAVTSITSRLGAGEDAGAVVTAVVDQVFGAAVAGAPADPATMNRIAAMIHAVLDEGDGQP